MIMIIIQNKYKSEADHSDLEGCGVWIQLDGSSLLVSIIDKSTTRIKRVEMWKMEEMWTQILFFNKTQKWNCYVKPPCSTQVDDSFSFISKHA
jgi:hypothetical protein